MGIHPCFFLCVFAFAPLQYVCVFVCVSIKHTASLEIPAMPHGHESMTFEFGCWEIGINAGNCNKHFNVIVF